MRDEPKLKAIDGTLYWAAMPQHFVQALIRHKSGQTRSIMLDELDKNVARLTRGDPASALLETLDPEQNREFSGTTIWIVRHGFGRKCCSSDRQTTGIPYRDRCSTAWSGFALVLCYIAKKSWRSPSTTVYPNWLKRAGLLKRPDETFSDARHKTGD